MLATFFQRVKVIIVVCLFVSVALPSISHAFEVKSEAYCEDVSFSNDHAKPQSIHTNTDNVNHESDGCDCCHSGCCNIKTLPQLSFTSPDFGMESLAFSNVPEFLVGTVGTDLFRPPKTLV